MKGCYIQTIGGVFAPKVSAIPKTIINAQNIYRLTRADRLEGMNLNDFCEMLDAAIRGTYSKEELLDLYNSGTSEKFDGVKVNVILRHGHYAKFRIERLSTKSLVLKYPDTTKLVVALFHDVSGIPGTEVLRDVLSVPLAACLSRAPDLSGTHAVYAHTFTNQTNFFGVRAESEPSYIGVTKRGWVVRWYEHQAAAKAGSPYRFHEAIRRFDRSNPVFHELLVCGASRDEAMRVEEWAVEAFSLYPKGFNMIPGGDAGIKYLTSKGAPRSQIDWEHREKAIRNLKNPLISALWLDDDYAASIICSNPNNFDRSKIYQIRSMSEFGKSPEEIADSLGCSPSRVKRLLRGETYSRVA
jgi:hypothetical protein